MLICMDGGGTKTEALLLTKDGHILKRCLGGPSNPNALGVVPAVAQVKSLILELLEDHGGLNANVSAIFCGLSGAGMRGARMHFESMCKSLFPTGTAIRIGSDALGALSSGVRKRDGVVVIAGTGSAAFCRKGQSLIQVGGWGQYIDDAGGGYDIARKAFRAVLRAYDGRAPQTALTEAFNEKLGAPIWESIPEIYQGGKKLMADFAPIVLNMQTDAVADKIAKEAATDLAEIVKAAGRHLPADMECPIVMAGSVWKNQLLCQRVQSQLSLRYQWIRPVLPPVYGSAVEAVADAGVEVDDAFEAQFQRSYKLS